MSITWKCFSKAFDENKSRIIAFNGSEGISKGYTFDILFKIDGVKLEDVNDFMKDILEKNTFDLQGIYNNTEKFSRKGIITRVTHILSTNQFSVFRAFLEPRSSDLNISCHSRIFMHMTLPNLVDKLLAEEGMSIGSHFENKMQAKYEKSNFTCQYNEYSNTFLARHLERNGCYYYIAQTDAGEKLVFADDTTQVEKLPIRHDLNLADGQQDAAVFSFFKSRGRTFSQFALTDYSPELTKPFKAEEKDSSELIGSASQLLYGERNIFGEVNIEDKDGISDNDLKNTPKLVTIALNAQKVKSHLTSGESTVPWLQAGYAITLDSEEFQIVDVKHMFNQAITDQEENIVRRARHAGFIPGVSLGYRNSFSCHPLSICAYTPESKTPRPNIGGFVHARTDGDPSSVYAQIDSQGRYHVGFFFPEKVIYTDGSSPANGRASIALRMIQAHVGPGSGIHIPVHRGVDVLVAFMGGDPDRPFIVGAMPNPKHKNIVTQDNAHCNIVKTPGGHTITMDDTKGASMITIESTSGNRIIMDDTPGKEEVRIGAAGSSNYFRIRTQS